MPQQKSKPNVAAFLISLAKSKRLQRAWVEDAEQSLKDFGLTKAHRDLILSGDLARIRRAVRREYPGSDVAFMVITFGPPRR